MSFGPSTTNKKLAAALQAIIEEHHAVFTADQIEALDEAATRIEETVSEDDDDNDDEEG